MSGACSCSVGCWPSGAVSIRSRAASRSAWGEAANRDAAYAAPPVEQCGALANDLLALGPLGGHHLAEQLAQEARHLVPVHGRGVLRQERGQLRAELLAALETVLGPRRQPLEHDEVEVARHAAGLLRRRHDARLAHPLEQIVLRIITGRPRRRREELPAGEQLPEDDGGGVEIGAPVEGFAPGLLGRHVADLAVDHAGGGLLELQGRGGQPEVGQLHLAGIGQEHVGRRDIAVDQPQPLEGVRVAQAAHQLLDDLHRHGQGKGHAPLRAAVPHRAQVLALDEVHAEVDLTLDLTGVEDPDQIAVRQAHDDLGLVLEALEIALLDQVRQRGLDHAQLLHPAVAVQRQVESAHTPARQGLDQDIPTEASRKAFHVSSLLLVDLRGTGARFLGPEHLRVAQTIHPSGAPGSREKRLRGSAAERRSGPCGPTGRCPHQHCS